MLRYKRLSNKKEHSNFFRYRNEDVSIQYAHTIATVWKLSFERIQTLNPMAVQILEVCAFLQPDAIPVSFFEHRYSDLNLTSVKQPSSQPQRFRGIYVLKKAKAILSQFQNRQSVISRAEEVSQGSLKSVRTAIGVLIQYSFVTRTQKKLNSVEENPASDLLTIHRLIQKVVFDMMDGKQRLYLAHNIATALSNEIYFNWSDVYTLHTRTTMDAYVSHIHHFVTLLDDLDEKSLIRKPIKAVKWRSLLPYGIWNIF